jgi:hypothetical protein
MRAICFEWSMIPKSGYRFSEKIMLNKAVERDDDSKKNHPALETKTPASGAPGVRRRSNFCFVRIFCLYLDTRPQNAPSRMAPTNANTAQIASISSLKARSTLHAPSLWHQRKSLAKARAMAKRQIFCAAQRKRRVLFRRCASPPNVLKVRAKIALASGSCTASCGPSQNCHEACDWQDSHPSAIMDATQ